MTVTRYSCSACGTPAIVSLGLVTRMCDCDAPVAAEASVTLVGEGGLA